MAAQPGHHAELRRQGRLTNEKFETAKARLLAT
jgi:hypothetical protein